MVEVEMKFHATDDTNLPRLLSELAATAQEPIVESDHYFNAPDRDFAKTDEALRLRRIGEQNRVTYKGPKRDALTKTRTEIEIPLASGTAVAHNYIALLERLGYRPVAIVHKCRTIYQLDWQGWQAEVCCDDVTDLGQFVEIEIVTNEDQLEAARTALLQLAAQLTLKDTERRSYLEMLLTKRGQA
jgi:adenylate cyclase class 2